MGEIAAHALGARSLGIYRDALDEAVAILCTTSGTTRGRSLPCCRRGR
jgi:long-chain acyl-CoA synthetase